MPSKLFLLAGFQLALTPLLIIVPFISATPSPSQPLRRGLLDRDPVIQQCDSLPVLPSGWNYLAYILDSPSQRTLTMSSFTDSTNMTIELCVNYCNSRHNIYAGLENGEDCYCGDVLTNGEGVVPSSSLTCATPCVGNSPETCGGSTYLSTYSSGAEAPPQPSSFPSVGQFKFVGCYDDSNDARALTVPTTVIGAQYNNTIENCAGACAAASYSKAGVEFANECYCDNSIQNGRNQLDDADCMMLGCSGNNTEYCGAANTIAIYSDD